MQYTTTTTRTGNVSGSVALTIAIIVIVLVLAYVIPFIIVQWKMFKKAGYGGWEAIVPIYSTYVFGMISKKPMWMVWAAVALSIIGSIPTVGTYTGIFSMIIGILLLVGFIKQYNATTGFWVCYILFPFVAVFMVNKVTHVGAGVPAAAGPQPAGTVPGAVGPIPGQPAPGPVATPIAPQPGVAPVPAQPVPPAQPVSPQPVQPVANPMPPTTPAPGPTDGQPGGTPPTA